MPDSTPTWRKVDGDIVVGRQRLIFSSEYDRFSRIRRHQLIPLHYFADGVVSWGFGTPTDVDGLRAALADGTLTLSPPAGAEVYVPGLGQVLAGPEEHSWTPKMLLGDIADELDRLNDRPDSSRRAYDAFLNYAAGPTEDGLETARSAYLTVPEHRRIYLLGDMDHNDVPARILLAGIGEEIPARRPGTTLTVTAGSKDWALDYFRQQAPALAHWQARKTADGPETAATPPLAIGGQVFPTGWPDEPGIEVLQNDYPAAVVYLGREYRSVTHAYWALSTGDPVWHDRIAEADRGFDAEDAAFEAPRRDGWPAARLAVMAALLRDKFHRHPRIAGELMSTGDARILYSDTGSCYWTRDRRAGTNWVGRLLEVVRSEIAADQAGIRSAARPD